MKLLILLLLIPIIEIMLFIEIGGSIGTGPTLVLTLLTAIIGLALIRQQGLRTLFRAQQKMNWGELPAFEMLEGMLFAIAGVCLLTPGFFTDTIGFIILVPPLRRAGILALTRITTVHHWQSPPADHKRTIEGEYDRHDKDT